MTTTSMAVAETILAQLGGSRFLAMTGAKNLMAGAQGLTMKLGRGALGGITHVKIRLDASDTYTATFLRVQGAMALTIAEVSGVYVEDLQNVFTNKTGFATRL